MIKASICCDPDTINQLEDVLYELAPSNWSLVVNRITEKGNLEGFFESKAQALESIDELKTLLAVKLSQTFVIADIPDQDWKEAYKSHFEPWSHGKIHWVPEWEKNSYEIPPEHHAVYLDPGMAFGTGNHETTRLCLESMISILEGFEPFDLLDVGCGSGILSLSANLLGIEKVKGVDNDPDSIKVSNENLHANNITGNVAFEAISLEKFSDEENFDIVVANIQADILMANSRTLLQLVRKGGYVVLSGILSKEVKLVKEHFLANLDEANLEYEVETRSLGEWSVIQTRIH